MAVAAVGGSLFADFVFFRRFPCFNRFDRSPLTMAAAPVNRIFRPKPHSATRMTIHVWLWPVDGFVRRLYCLAEPNPAPAVAPNRTY